jgi:hypothetical protein
MIDCLAFLENALYEDFRPTSFTFAGSKIVVLYLMAISARPVQAITFNLVFVRLIIILVKPTFSRVDSPAN